MTARLPSRLATLAALALVLAVPGVARANGPDGVVSAAPAKSPNDGGGIDPKVGATVPLDAEFRDEEDRPITLRACINGKPTILVPMYYRCPKLCNIVLDELVQTLRKMPNNYNVGKEFNVVCLSFDPKERNSRAATQSLAAEKKANTVGVYGRPGAEAGWHFLTGDKDAIKECMEAVGYRYEYDRVFKEYNHPSGIIVLTPGGKISRYFYGINFDGPKQLADANAEVDEKYLLPGELIPRGMTTLRLSLVEASDGKLGSLADQVWLMCSSFEYGKGYSVKLAVQIGGIVTLLAVAGWVGLTLRREFRRNREQNPPHDATPSGGTT